MGQFKSIAIDDHNYQGPLGRLFRIHRDCDTSALFDKEENELLSQMVPRENGAVRLWGDLSLREREMIVNMYLRVRPKEDTCPTTQS